MAVALYRRYRPDTFQDLIGQEQVTAPLMTALDNNRVNHAYLFSGPRGCGKTTSARILARCLNCAEGPTSTPCGKCESCVELATGGPGSLDVIEIDAASHNGVDDARELRERAIFAPTRDRYKIFVLDEAHMITPAGFNALLKVVEEPPEHVKFIFATTEPERVIGTIRSRTHHYPFRLVPPATLLPFLERILHSEQLAAEPGVLPLAIRAGGGSVRDTLSVLDQLIAGSADATINYQRTVQLLGYTSTELLTRCIDAMAVLDSNTLFQTLEQILQAGLDPRRFAEDLLGRLRDLILVKATGDSADTVLHGTPADELGLLHEQVAKFGMAQLSHAAAIVSNALNNMTSATNPRVQLEMMCARLVLPRIDHSELGALARVEAMEQRLDVAQPKPAKSSTQPTAVVEPKPVAASSSMPEPEPEPEPEPTRAPVAESESEHKTGTLPAPTPAPVPAPSVAETAAADAQTALPAAEKSAAGNPAAEEPAAKASGNRAETGKTAVQPKPVTAEPAPEDEQIAERSVEAQHQESAPAAPAPVQAESVQAESVPAESDPAVAARPEAVQPEAVQPEAVQPEAVQPEPVEADSVKAEPTAPVRASAVSLQQIRDAWPQVLNAVEQKSQAAWAQVSAIGIRSYNDGILTLVFPSKTNADAFRNPKSQHQAPEVLRHAIDSVLGINVKYLAKIDAQSAPGTRPAAQQAGQQSAAGRPQAHEAQPHSEEPPAHQFYPADDSDEVPGWEPAPDPDEYQDADESAPQAAVPEGPHTAQYGEAVLRERLGAVPIDDDHRRH